MFILKMQLYKYLILNHFLIGYKVWLLHGEKKWLNISYERKWLNISDKTRVMSQDDNERVLDNNSMCDMVKDAFGYHQHSMMDDREIGV